jgi:hypothetical protein
MQRCADWLGLAISLTQNITLRFPLYLTLIMAIMTFLTTLKMKEVTKLKGMDCFADEARRTAITEVLKLTFRAASWFSKTPFALVIIVTGLIFDHILRLLVTLNSIYYRLISLPEASFGLIGAARAVLGVFVTRIALKLTKNHSPRFNLAVMAFITLLGLFGMALFLPIIGILPAFLLSSVMFLLNFFLSHYLNRITSSRQRATVLSFKGLSFNLAYGAIGLFYSFFLSMIRAQVSTAQPSLQGEGLENTVFIHSITYFPWYFIVMMVLLVAFARWHLRHSMEHKMAG